MNVDLQVEVNANETLSLFRPCGVEEVLAMRPPHRELVFQKNDQLWFHLQG